LIFIAQMTYQKTRCEPSLCQPGEEPLDIFRPSLEWEPNDESARPAESTLSRDVR
jgi:hypothetical protein